MGTATVTRVATAPYDPLTDSIAPPVPDMVLTVDCVVLPAGDRQQATKLDDLAVANSVTMYAPSTYAPQVGDRVVIPQQVTPFTLVSFKTMAPDGYPIYSKCALERTPVA